MAGFRYCVRQLRSIASSHAFQGLCACLCFFVGFQQALRHYYQGGDSTRSVYARSTTSVEDPSIGWSKLSYVQQVTSPEQLCNALMIWSDIEQIGSRAQRLMIYPSHWDEAIDNLDPAPGLTLIRTLLQSAVTDYYVTLQPVEDIYENHTSQSPWANSGSKFLPFSLTSYSRVLVLEAGSIVLQNLDALFLLPRAPIAMPYIYWGEPSGWGFSSQMMLLEPSQAAFAAIETAINGAQEDEYDMDIIERLYKGKILKIPQRPYNLLSGEFRRTNHAAYLGSRSVKWDPDAILAEARFLQFSDGPFPKPWVRARKGPMNKHMPRCSKSEWFGATDCRDRTIWLQLYSDFTMKRKAVCGSAIEEQSQELRLDSGYRHGRWFHPDGDGDD